MREYQQKRMVVLFGDFKARVGRSTNVIGIFGETLIVMVDGVSPSLSGQSWLY